ncbi:MAG: prolyl oligopeptidase family serine peptidase, partial [Pseudomonadota bacterium]
RFALMGREPDRFRADCAHARLLTATSDDGTKVPYRLVLPKGAAPGDCPVLMYAYGGFGTSVVPGYLGLWGKLWVERGGAYVLAHIRGGSEFGPGWHKAAVRENRPRAFEDFAAVASDLCDRGITRPHRIACRGASNGGLLTAVMLTRYPHRFGAVWSVVPVTDMLRFHTFEAGKAWIDEYGDPDQAADRAWLAAYSPFHTVAPRADITYPATYIETSKSDDRVDPSHALRLCAQLRAHGHDPLFHQFGDGGHGGGGSTSERARELAMGLAFLRQTIAAPSALDRPQPLAGAAAE